jgi:hypothetical protein
MMTPSGSTAQPGDEPMGAWIGSHFTMDFPRPRDRPPSEAADLVSATFSGISWSEVM